MLPGNDSSSGTAHSHLVVSHHSVRYIDSVSAGESTPCSMHCTVDNASDENCDGILGTTKITPHNAPTATP